jgi:hypothetical protein
MIGVEPTWIAPPDPKSGASANFATSGKGCKAKGLPSFLWVKIEKTGIYVWLYFGCQFLQ